MGISREAKAFKAALFAVGLKVCSRCKEIKPVPAFTKKRAAADGLQGYCSPCGTERTAEWCASNRERRREYMSAWNAEYNASLRGRIAQMRGQQSQKVKRLKERISASI